MGQDIILALKGWEGWGDQRSAHLRWSTSISLGAKVRKGVKVWPVGRWSPFTPTCAKRVLARAKRPIRQDIVTSRLARRDLFPADHG